MESQELYSKVVWQDESGLNQTRLVVNEFKSIEYIHLRKYYLGFDGDWLPTDKGISMPLEIESTRELFEGMAEIISLAESRAVIEAYFGDIINKVYNSS